MRVAYASDLHLDINVHRCPYENTEGADLLILAGDVIESFLLGVDPTGIITPTEKEQQVADWFKKVAAEFKTVLWVMGNHEHYGSNLDNTAETIRKFLKHHDLDNVRLLDSDVYEQDGVRFVGTTLWTDFYGADPIAMWDCQRMMSDYREITVDKPSRRLTTTDIMELHQQQLEFIQNSLDHDNCVVVTHHLPTKLGSDPTYNHNNVNAAYVNNLVWLIEKSPQIKYWIAGHSHHNVREKIGETVFSTNCRGYYGYETMANTFKYEYFDV